MKKNTDIEIVFLSLKKINSISQDGKYQYLPLVILNTGISRPNLVLQYRTAN